MSKDGTILTEEHFAFVAARTIPEDALLTELRVAAKAAGLPEIHIAPEQAAFLQILLRIAKARDVVEVGTLGGYSAIAMARGLPESGKIVTLELDETHAQFAREWIGKSDVADKIEVRVGDARSTMTELPATSCDAVFLDADKDGYVTYLEQAARILRTGGVLLADNVFAGGAVIDSASTSPTAIAIRAFHEAVAARRDFTPVIVPLGDGCLMAIKD